MRIEQQVANVAQCKKLKELGIKQSGFFSWLYNITTIQHEISSMTVEGIELIAKSDSRGESFGWRERIEKGIYSAFTVAELGVMNRGDVRTYHYDGFWSAYIPFEGVMKYFGNVFKTEAELRAAILIQEIENKIVMVEEINSKL